MVRIIYRIFILDFFTRCNLFLVFEMLINYFEGMDI
tara:strand:+ start:1605 stop:1712 length:108 start_codon:yes stop_codon:yes gene_type:complete